MTGIGDIQNVIQIDDLTASGGQPSAAQFRDARAAGYEVVINLAPDGREGALPDEAALLADMGIDYHHIPVDWKQPTLDDLAAFFAVMDAVRGRRTLIHCQANFRVTAFYSLYAMARLGWSADQARALRDRVWTTLPGYRMDDAWADLIDTASRTIGRSE